jgi:osmotically-inducible protein OsmY
MFSLTACASHPPAENTARYSNDDGSLNSRVQVAVNDVRGVRPGDITSHTQDAVVTLQGTVDNQRSAEFAVQAARQVPGVERVDYNIKYAP